MLPFVFRSESTLGCPPGRGRHRGGRAGSAEDRLMAARRPRVRVVLRMGGASASAAPTSRPGGGR